MTEKGLKSGPVRPSDGDGNLDRDYFRLRDFEYAQPLYDLAFLLEMGSLAGAAETPKYRANSLRRAAYSLDGYGTTIDRWLEGSAPSKCLDYVPSSNIAKYLAQVRSKGSIEELRRYEGERYARALRLRAARGLGPQKIAALSAIEADDNRLKQVASQTGAEYARVLGLYTGADTGPWQTAHLVPPMLRFLAGVEEQVGQDVLWAVSGIDNALSPVTEHVRVFGDLPWRLLSVAMENAAVSEKLFAVDIQREANQARVIHQMGWEFTVQPARDATPVNTIRDLAMRLDPLTRRSAIFASDLHVHSTWSDGTASLDLMAEAASNSGLDFFAVTDHSRSCKVQGGLTPSLWLRQANALLHEDFACPVLHGIEVDILRDGGLDLPPSLLDAADFVVASVHTSWTTDLHANTDRAIRAVESGHIDVLGHPTSAVVGKPGIPNYYRPPAAMDWDVLFERCARWGVALEVNCFPSRLDLPQDLLGRAVEAGCAISLGSDSHARSHLCNLRFGEVAVRQHLSATVLNRMPGDELGDWLAASRANRHSLGRTRPLVVQAAFDFGEDADRSKMLSARISPSEGIPAGSKVVGIDLTAGNKTTGVALLEGNEVTAVSLMADEQILEYIRAHQPAIVSIDSPLGLPGGGEAIKMDAGIVRVAERDLGSVGIPAYPALIDSMRNLTLRGIRLRTAIEQFAGGPEVIESYPGAAQDILSIPRKQRSLDLLREGLRRLGLTGDGLETRSHDEMDAITSAVVGRYYEAGRFEAMGIPSEAQLIVPKVSPLKFDADPVICLAGKTGAGKSVVARYLALFYGFEWVRTRDVLRQLLEDDLNASPGQRLWRASKPVESIREDELQQFGAAILQQHRQIPLRRKLAEVIRSRPATVVVDAIRDTVDVDPACLEGRPLLTWFVDCSDSIIQHRLAGRNKNGDSRRAGSSPVDCTATDLQSKADSVIPNEGSLEDLRWSVDDVLFGSLEIAVRTAL